MAFCQRRKPVIYHIFSTTNGVTRCGEPTSECDVIMIEELVRSVRDWTKRIEWDEGRGTAICLACALTMKRPWRKKRDARLRSAVRAAVQILESGPMLDLEPALTAIRGQVAPDIHVGRSNMTPMEQVEWYAGQLLAIVDSKSVLSMPSFIGALDRFCPAGEVK